MTVRAAPRSGRGAVARLAPAAKARWSRRMRSCVGIALRSSSLLLSSCRTARALQPGDLLSQFDLRGHMPAFLSTEYTNRSSARVSK